LENRGILDLNGERKSPMSTIANNVAYVQQWKQLCIAALAELNPAKVPERIAVARSAVLDQIEDNLSKSSSNEQSTLRNALEALDVLRKIVQRKVAQSEGPNTTRIPPMIIVPKERYERCCQILGSAKRQ